MTMTTVWIDDGDRSQSSDAAAAAEAELIEPMPVPLTAPRMRTRYTDRPIRPSSNFIAQLMAIDGGYSQSRDCHRAEPGQATAAYRSANGKGFAPPAGGRT
jgi:hypothetical protein